MNPKSHRNRRGNYRLHPKPRRRRSGVGRYYDSRFQTERTQNVVMTNARQLAISG